MTMTDDAKKTKGLQTDLTHEEIAQKLGVSRAAVSLMEKKALNKLKKVLKERHNVRQSDDLL